MYCLCDITGRLYRALISQIIIFYYILQIFLVFFYKASNIIQWISQWFAFILTEFEVIRQRMVHGVGKNSINKRYHKWKNFFFSVLWSFLTCYHIKWSLVKFLGRKSIISSITLFNSSLQHWAVKVIQIPSVHYKESSLNPTKHWGKVFPKQVLF